MTIAELINIIKKADRKVIAGQLKRLGYTNCAKDKRYKHISLVTLYNGDTQETEEILFDNETKAVDGSIITNVQGFEQTEFIQISFYRVQTTVFAEEEKTAVEEYALIFAK